MTVPDSALKSSVKEKYGQAALRVTSGQGNSCCGGAAACGTAPGNTRSENEEIPMGRSILLWLLGVPIPIIILIALLSH